MRDPIEIQAHDGDVSSLIFTKAGDALLSAGMDNVVRVWLSPGWEGLGAIEGHANSVNCMALSSAEDRLIYSPDGRYMALAAADKRVRIWEIGG